MAKNEILAKTARSRFEEFLGVSVDNPPYETKVYREHFLLPQNHAITPSEVANIFREHLTDDLGCDSVPAPQFTNDSVLVSGKKEGKVFTFKMNVYRSRTEITLSEMRL